MDRHILLNLLKVNTESEALDLIASRVAGMLHVPEPGELLRFDHIADEINKGNAIVMRHGGSWAWVGKADAPAYLNSSGYLEICGLLQWTGETLEKVGDHLYRRVPINQS